MFSAELEVPEKIWSKAFAGHNSLHFEWSTLSHKQALLNIVIGPLSDSYIKEVQELATVYSVQSPA